MTNELPEIDNTVIHINTLPEVIYKNKVTEELVTVIPFQKLEENTDTGFDIKYWVMSRNGRSEGDWDGDICTSLKIHTLGGWMVVSLGDYVVYSEEDGFLPYSSLTFESMFEPLPKPESNLVAHARRELELVGEDPSIIADCLKVVQAFADMGHSGSSAFFFTDAFTKLFSYGVLSPLTNNPEEWYFHGEDFGGGPDGVWQNIRGSSCFSNDGGLTFYDLNEIVDGVKVFHTSVDVRGENATETTL